MDEIMKLDGGLEVALGLNLPDEEEMLLMSQSPMYPESRNLEDKDIQRALAGDYYKQSRLEYKDFMINQNPLGKCLPAGSKVTMADGSLKAIEDVEFGDFVLTHLGNHRQVVDTMSRNFTGDLVTIQVQSGFDLTVTEDHLIWVDNEKWVKAGELKAGDNVTLVKNASEGVHSIDVALVAPGEFVYDDGRIKTRRGHGFFPQWMELGELECRFFGLYCAEGATDTAKGSLWPNRVTIAAHRDDETAKALVQEFCDKYDLEMQTHELVGSSLGVAYRINNSVLARLMKECCGYLANGKHAPTFIMNSGEGQKLAFLQGWILGDGFIGYKPEGHEKIAAVSKNQMFSGALVGSSLRINATTISRDLAMQAFALAHDLGMNPRTQTTAGKVRKDGGYRQTSYILCLYGPHAERVLDCKFVGKHGNPRSTIEGDKHSCRKIKSVSRESVKDTHVYDFTVDQDHSFVAETVAVHNCNASAVKGAIEQIRKVQGMPRVVLSDNDAYMQMNGGRDRGSALIRAFEGVQTRGIAPLIIDLNGREYSIPLNSYNTSQLARGAAAAATKEAARFRGWEWYKAPKTFQECCRAVASELARRNPVVFAWHVGGSSSRLRNGYAITGRGMGNHATMFHSAKWVGGSTLVHPDCKNSWGPSQRPDYGSSRGSWGEGGFALFTMEQAFACARYHDMYIVTSARPDYQDQFVKKAG